MAMIQPTIEQVAAMAWDVSKDASDPPFHSCQIDHRERLIYLAQNVLQSGVVSSPFEHQVALSLRNPKEVLAQIKARAVSEEVKPEPVSQSSVKVIKKKGK